MNIDSPSKYISLMCRNVQYRMHVVVFFAVFELKVQETTGSSARLGGRGKRGGGQRSVSVIIMRFSIESCMEILFAYPCAHSSQSAGSA